jgi:hypothetical protein
MCRLSWNLGASPPGTLKACNRIAFKVFFKFIFRVGHIESGKLMYVRITNPRNLGTFKNIFSLTWQNTRHKHEIQNKKLKKNAYPPALLDLHMELPYMVSLCHYNLIGWNMYYYFLWHKEEDCRKVNYYITLPKEIMAADILIISQQQQNSFAQSDLFFWFSREVIDNR